MKFNPMNLNSYSKSSDECVKNPDNSATGMDGGESCGEEGVDRSR
jgi:hypothetical protein